ncbi:Intercellular adhesion protein C [Chlamydia abortus]|uniref:acyltransferase n=1 Tax=Paenibacillus sp. SAFN-117 TaxID=3436860 RepID=UPI000A27BD89|nr:Intercellular adhesion protein C [Chlamydia abortus]
MEQSTAIAAPTEADTGSASSSGKSGKSAGRIRELELLRAFAIGAVVIIHATAGATVEAALGSRSQLLYLLVNRLSLFAVPIFILLSGIVLFYRYSKHWSLSEAISFYRKRLQFIVIPYLLWSLFYSYFNPWFYKTVPLSALTPDLLLDQLLWGTSSYHLYFMVIIIQFYAVFPILMTLIHRFPSLGKALPWIGLVLQAGAYAYRYYGGGLEHGASLAVTYAFVFAVGGWIGLNYDRFRQWLDSYSWVATAAAVAVGGAYTLLHVVSRYGIKFGWETEAVLFHLYGVAAAAGLLVLCRHLSNYKGISRFLTSIGAVSFGIYFVHPVLLSVYRAYWTAPPGSLSYHWLTIGGFFIIFTLSWGISRGIKSLPGGWILLGR